MRIIKPYGRSVADKIERKIRKIRKIRKTNADADELENIDKLLAEDELLIAQWVGVIDKIMPKPKEKPRKGSEEKQAAELQERRKLLSNAAWKYLLKKHKLKAPTEMEHIWQRRLAATQPKAPRDDKGRWHKAFIGFMPLNGNFADGVAEKIDRHLTKCGFSIQGEIKQKRIGLAPHRSHAVTKNILKKADKRHAESQRAENEAVLDTAAYGIKAGNFAAEIKAAILAIWVPLPKGEKRQQGQGYQVPPFNIAVEILRKCVWRRLFGDGIGDFVGADKQDRELLHTHLAVKETYKRLLKGQKRLNHEKLNKILPADNEALFRLLDNKKQNQSLNHLIRLGKIVHYTAAEKARKAAAEGAKGDSPAFIAQYWPTKDEVENSDYWTSAGQTKIKQNEALVRVWRRALAFAARTLKDWAETVGEKIDGDVLFSLEGILKAFTAEKSYAAFDKRYRLLLSDNAAENCPALQTVPERAAAMAFALTGLAALRNAAFHFKGMGTFVQALQDDELPQAPDNIAKLFEGGQEEYHKRLKQAQTAADSFYEQGQKYYQQQLKAVMEAAFFHKFLSRDEIEKLWIKLNENADSALPMPRLKRVLERAEDAWKGTEKRALPIYSSADKREGEEETAKWLHCQYTALKLLYDRPFSVWFSELKHEKLQGYINTAIKHTTAAAKKMHNKDSFLELIAAKAESLEKLKVGEQADKFFSKLISATAEGFGVQKGYASDGGKAKEQASYIEKFKCDVVALAFEEYLPQVLDNIGLFCAETRREKEQSNFSYDSLDSLLLAAVEKAEPWQAKLYFLLHFMPVEAAAGLRHQLRKWQVVTQAEKMEGKRGDAEKEHKLIAKALAGFDLYLALHDAQFMVAGREGRQLSELEDTYKQYFADENDFGIVFPPQDGQENPQAFRGLREMQRFGGDVLKYLSDKKPPEIPQEHKVRHNSVTDLELKPNNEAERKKLKKDIAAAQKDRTQLHAEWASAKDKKQWQQKNGEKYAELVQKISRHQHLTAEIMLQNPLRLHRLLMNVLGRLVDFSGLFERDVYFALLALLHKKYGSLAPEQRQSDEERATQETDKAKDRKTPLGKQFLPALKKKENEDANGETIKKPNAHGVNLFTDGQIIEAFCKLTEENRDIRDKIAKFFSITGADTSYKEREGKKYKLSLKESDVLLKQQDFRTWIRNRFAHLAALESDNLPINLTAEVNKARALMAYDRKLKNAVSQSIKEMLEREGLLLEWEMHNHKLAKAKVAAKPIKHLGGAGVLDENDKGEIKKNKWGIIKQPITEPRHGKANVQMAAALFGVKIAP